MSRMSVLALALLLVILPGTLLAQVDSLTLIGRFDSGLGEGATEIVAFDAASQRMFTVNAENNSIDVVDLSDPTAPVLALSIALDTFGAGVNSVAVANGYVAVAVEADPKQEPGQVVFFDVQGNFLNAVTAGALPDMVAFTPDGSKVLVANEGEPSDDYTVDPEGSVTIIDLSNGVNDATTTTVGFGDFNDGGPRASELPADVRIFGPGASVAQDLEPEFIAVSPDGTTAWVALQEANAVAILDIANGTFTAIAALGFKDHSQAGNALDASNRDDAINIQNWPVLGMYQPDAVAAYDVGGTTYVISANEGDSRDYDGFSEEERMGDLNLDPTAFPDAADLQMDENLGRLKTTTTLGDDDGDGDFDRLFAYGARSFSIWNGGDGSLIFDSGDQFEQITAAQVPAIFNSDGSDPDEFDDRSDDKGPEPEAVVVGYVGGQPYAFIGLERIGGVMVYNVSDPAAPQFNLYEPSGVGDLAPEGLAFVSSDQSPNGQPLLLVSNEDSGTVAVYQIGLVGGSECVASDEVLCLQRGRFAVSADWETTEDSGKAKGEALTLDTGTFYFFNENNIELVVKVLDGCVDPFNSFWVFAGGLTDVEVTLTVTDTLTGDTKTYENGLGTPFEPIRDTQAFKTCP